jgi:esterase/lipase superfamily enzyme
MNREYRKWHSDRLGREMELLIFGHAGLPVIVFPTSAGRFYEFEDNGMVRALEERIEAGGLQLFCVDSIDAESWYNRKAPPRWRMARHLLYEEYVLEELVPLVRSVNPSRELVALGCSFGGYHAANLALRHPDVVTGMLSLSGTFDVSGFLDGYYDQDCYYNLPTHYLPQLNDAWYLEHFRRNSFVLATGWDDHCLVQNQQFDQILTAKQIPHQFYVWDAKDSHDWPAWQQMVSQYL